MWERLKRWFARRQGRGEFSLTAEGWKELKDAYEKRIDNLLTANEDLNRQIASFEDRMTAKDMEVAEAQKREWATHRSADGTANTINRLLWERDLYRDVLMEKKIELPSLKGWQKKQLGLSEAAKEGADRVAAQQVEDKAEAEMKEEDHAGSR